VRLGGLVRGGRRPQRGVRAGQGHLYHGRRRDLEPAGLSSVELLFGVSCLPDAGGNTTCYVGGTVQAQVEGLTENGWFNSISCASTQNCWAGGAGTTDALAGTSDAGSSWSVVTSDTSNEGGYVSCLSVSTCVAVTDNGGVGDVGRRRADAG
jgi:hypothetical protein